MTAPDIVTDKWKANPYRLLASPIAHRPLPGCASKITASVKMADDQLRGLIGAQIWGNRYMRSFGTLIGTANASEILDQSISGALIQALWITTFRHLKRRIDKDFDKLSGGNRSCAIRRSARNAK